VLTPAFYARKDVKTPVWIAMGVLLGGIIANFVLIPRLGIYSLATVTSASAWINFGLLFVILYARNQFRMPAWLIGRVGKQLLAALVMGASLYAVKLAAGSLFFGGVLERIIGVGALVGVGGIVYFAVAWMIGGMDREAIAALRRRAKSEELAE
jgi:putative peptidoglycan lipid II flippase